jgi:hypothetical protein
MAYDHRFTHTKYRYASILFKMKAIEKRMNNALSPCDRVN